MTQAQRNAIASPATGLVVYQTDNSPGLYCYCIAAPDIYASWQALALQQPTYCTFPVSNSSVPNTQGGALLPLNYPTASSGVNYYPYTPGSIYIQVTGLYRVDYNLTLSYPDKTTLRVQLVKNGARPQSSRDNQFTNPTTDYSNATAIDESFILLNAGDVIAVRLLRNDASTFPTNVGTGIVSLFRVN